MNNTTPFIGCKPAGTYSTLNFTVGDMLNPFLFFTKPSTLCQYANIASCERLPDKFYFFQSFCKDLLPFCIFYSFIKVLITTMNYVFLYKLKIERRIKRNSEQALLPRWNHSYISFFQRKVRSAFFLDIVSSIFTVWIFTGYQYYASKYNMIYETCHNPDGTESLYPNDFLIGTPCKVHYKADSIAYFFAVIIWFLIECGRTYIQIFSVSTLTHLDNLRRESRREQPNPERFYSRHEKFAKVWASVLFIIGFLLIFANFFMEMFTNDTSFADYKLHYRYYSTSTVSFWLSYDLVLILILTDRILAFDGFRKRQTYRVVHERQERNNQSLTQSDNLVTLAQYQIFPGTAAFRRLWDDIKEKFPRLDENQSNELARKVAKMYTDIMKENYESLKAKLTSDVNHMLPIKTSLAYVKFLRGYNIINVVGYVFMLLPYGQQEPDKQFPPNDLLPSYLTGFIISAISTFAFDLIHNYMMYRSYFLQVLKLVERGGAEDD